MKKLFISCPVKGRKIEDVIKTRKKMHAIAEIIFEQELEVIDSVMAREVYDGDSFDSLVHHLNCMKDADYFIGIPCYGDGWRDCHNEHDIARDYGLPAYTVDMRSVAPDVFEINRNSMFPKCAGTTLLTSEG
jgi:hypothetical protein